MAERWGYHWQGCSSYPGWTCRPSIEGKKHSHASIVVSRMFVDGKHISEKYYSTEPLDTGMRWPKKLPGVNEPKKILLIYSRVIMLNKIFADLPDSSDDQVNDLRNILTKCSSDTLSGSVDDDYLSNWLSRNTRYLELWVYRGSTQLKEFFRCINDTEIQALCDIYSYLIENDYDASKDVYIEFSSRLDPCYVCSLSIASAIKKFPTMFHGGSLHVRMTSWETVQNYFIQWRKNVPDRIIEVEREDHSCHVH